MIEIILAKRREFEDGAIWACDLEITRVVQTWALPATAPGDLAKGELQAYFEADEDRLWVIAERKANLPDVFRLVDRDTLEAFALVVMDELNLLRQQHLLPERTPAQIKARIKGKLKNL